MQNILDDLTELLKKDDRFASEGKLLKNKVVEAALKPDEDLLRLLLKDKTTKKYFFKEIDGVFVFDKIQFQKFVSNKSFLPDSYTAFSNKIGLTSNDEFISESKDVVLSWPYKDCVLEGGQTKEEEKRNEIFWNETLAPDEIDRLLSPKVFTNFKKYDKSGEHKVKDISLDDNLIIKGNNLLALHSLLPVYREKVKLIYIDPPYNTGNDSFGYNDSFNHSTWLTFMKNRLEVAWDLLDEKGAIFIQCDDNEQAYLKILCDNLFKNENFKECISVKNGSESGVNAINVLRGEQLFKVKEHLLYYSKNASVHRFNPFYVKAIKFNMSYKLEVIKKGNSYNVTDIYKKTLMELYSKDSMNGLNDEQKQIFYSKLENYCIENSMNIFALKSDIQKSGEKFKEFANKNKKLNKVEEYLTSDKRINLVYKGGMLSSLKERMVYEGNKKYYGTLISDFWWDIGATPSTEGKVDLKSGKKSEKLLKRILKLCTNEGDIVLDFFLGSGSTCSVAMKMKRKFIGIEQLEYGENDSINRLNNVIHQDDSGISKDKDINWQGGGTFISCELTKLNQNFADQITSSKTTKDLKSIWENMKKSGFISYKIEPKDIDKNIKEFEKLSLENQKKFLIKVLDKNHLYVNFSEIDDKDYKVSEEDKKLNREFYNLK